MNRVADAILGGPTFEKQTLIDVMTGQEDKPGAGALALRLFGGVHRLVLSGNAPRLANFYPSAGGTFDEDNAWSAFVDTVSDNASYCRIALDSPPQTNEVGRSAGLLSGFLCIGGLTKLPLRLLEIGTSAGLNLRWDQFEYQLPNEDCDDGAVTLLGSPGSGVRFPASWFTNGTNWIARSKNQKLQDLVPIVESRSGCDLSPLDISTQDGRLMLMSYIWPEQEDRINRMKAAIEIANRYPANIACEDAASWLTEQLSQSTNGVCTVIFHSIFQQYLHGDEDRRRLFEIIRQAGGRATLNAPIAWLRMEPSKNYDEEDRALWPGGKAEIGLTWWSGQPEETEPGNQRNPNAEKEFHVADCGFHGYPILPPKRLHTV